MLNGRSRRHSAGVSLIELMVGITIGLFVLVGLSSVYINSVRGGRTTTASNQLNQELRALMDIMVNDIRRAGHWAGTGTAGANPFTQATTLPVISNLAANRDCILYSYDANFVGGVNGAVDAGIDFAGFRLNEAGVVQAVNSTTLANTTLPCGQVNWDDLTDPVSTQVTVLTFDTVGSKCRSFNPATNAAVQWARTAGSGPPASACDIGAPGAPSPHPNLANTNHLVETRQVNIVLTGRSRTDPTLPALTLRESVLIRANRVITP